MRTHQYAQKKEASSSFYTSVPRPYEVQPSVQPPPMQAKSNEEGLAEHAERLRKFQRLGNSMIQMGPPRFDNDQTSSLQPNPWIQRKLTLGQPGDKYEQEADRVASQVVEQINAPASKENNLRQSIQREKDLAGEMQAKCFRAAIQRKQAIAGGEALPDLESAINSARGGGQPLNAGLQQSMGQVMGADFSGVRVHTNTQSDKLNQSIQARAFTTGEDLFFRQGAYQPENRGGQELIAHELTHVLQQNGKAVRRQKEQGRGKGKVNVNDDAELEKEADVMGAKALQQKKLALQQGQERVQPPKQINSNNPILQGIWDKKLPKSDGEMVKLLNEKYPNAKVVLWKVRRTRLDPKPYKSIEEIAIDLKLKGAVVPDKQDTPAPIKKDQVEKPYALVKDKPKLVEKLTTPAKVKPKKKGKKEHKPVWDGGTELQINNVWVGNKPLKALEKYNIYSWRALGHKVTIYALRPDEEAVSLNKLGLEKGDAEVMDIRKLLTADDKEAKDKSSKTSPKAALTHTRGTLATWIKQLAGLHKEQVEKDEVEEKLKAIKSKLEGKNLSEKELEKLTKDEEKLKAIKSKLEGKNLSQEVVEKLTEYEEKLKERKDAMVKEKKGITLDTIFNLVDVIKSYIGGTQQGIVLDMKVGPSVHIEDYAASMKEKFISYTRGRNAFTVENQSMGTMAENDTTRLLYAGKFDSRMKSMGVGKQKVNTENLYNDITGIHGAAWNHAKGLDVATQTPTGKPIKAQDYKVEEPDALGKGPFRVHKSKDDQTHKMKGIKSPGKVQQLTKDMWKAEFSGIEDKLGFIEKMEQMTDMIEK